jgi:hypothetical protein
VGRVHLCTPLDISELDVNTANHRVVVERSTKGKDAAGGATVQYFAIAASDTARAGRLMLLAEAALTSGWRIELRYGHTATTLGCAIATCRTPLDYSML